MQKIAEVAVDKSVRLLGTDAAVFFIFDENQGLFVPILAKGIPLPSLSSFHMVELPDNKGTTQLLSKIIMKPYKTEGSVFIPFYDKERKKYTCLLLVLDFKEKVINQKIVHLLNVLSDRLMNAIENFTLLQEREKALIELEVDKEKLEKMNKELREKNELIKQINEDLQIKSRTDFLTGLLNRRAIFEYLDKEIEKSQKQNRIFSVSMIDIDNFKQINDQYGHDIGDEVLKDFALFLTNGKILRKADITGRFGGDEFIIIFPGTKIETAKIPLMKIHTRFIQNSFKIRNRNDFPVTFSAGAAEYSEKDMHYEVIKRADEALIQAKKSGRNMICYSG